VGAGCARCGDGVVGTAEPVLEGYVSRREVDQQARDEERRELFVAVG